MVNPQIGRIITKHLVYINYTLFMKTKQVSYDYTSPSIKNKVFRSFIENQCYMLNTSTEMIGTFIRSAELTVGSQE